MQRPSLKMSAAVKRFIEEKINAPGSNETLGMMNFREIVAYANANGYKLKDTELLKGLNLFFANKILLPHWMEKRVGGLAIWDAWEERE